MQRLVCFMHSYRLADSMVKMELVYGFIYIINYYYSYNLLLSNIESFVFQFAIQKLKD